MLFSNWVVHIEKNCDRALSLASPYLLPKPQTFLYELSKVGK